jgi:hypothetical protein
VEFTLVRGRLPEDYIAIPLTSQQLNSPIRICALVRKEPEPVGGQLILLRDMLDARIYLGCVTDAAGQVLRWAEIWVQELDRFIEVTRSSTVGREALSNLVLDNRWKTLFESLSTIEGGSVFTTGWETNNPPPILLSVERGRAFHLTQQGQDPWALCKDDAVLKARNLPLYSTTLHRYLYQTPRGIDSQFIPMTSGAPTNEATATLESHLPSGTKLLRLNPSAGLMMVREYSTVGFDELVDMLAGGAWGGVTHGKSRLRVGAVPAEGENAQSLGGWLFLGHHGKAGRFAEAFHLKCRLLTDLVDSVRTITERTQRPLLNLKPESFEIDTDEVGRGLPILWCARARLVDPGGAISLKIPSGETKYYMPGKDARLNVFLPAVVGQVCRGAGQFMIRRLQPSVNGLTILDGTLDTREHVTAQKNDMMWLRVNLVGEPVDIYARLEPQKDSLAEGQIRFRTLGQRLDERIINALKEAEGAVLPQVPFEIIPLLSSPCDLYSLGVLAVKIFLTSPKLSLPEQLGNVIALARVLGRQHNGDALRVRLRQILDSDRRFVDLLGPHRMIHHEITPEQAGEFIPSEIWWDLIGTMVQMFPGYGPDSYCEDFGDAPAKGIHRVFDKVSASLESLLIRSRSLLFVDWKLNREMHAVIRKARKTGTR